MEMLWLDVRDKLFNFGIILWGWGVVNNCFGVCPNSRICVSRATFSLGSIILYKARYIIKPRKLVLFFPPLPWKHGTACAITTALQDTTHSYRTDLLQIYNYITASLLCLCKITIFSRLNKWSNFTKAGLKKCLNNNLSMQAKTENMMLVLCIFGSIKWKSNSICVQSPFTASRELGEILRNLANCFNKTIQILVNYLFKSTPPS